MTTQQQPAGRIMLRNVRLAFAQNIFTPGTVNGEGEPRYSATFILTPDHPQLDKVRAVIKAVADEKWGKKADAMLKSMAPKDRLALKDGDGKAQYDGFEGNFYVTAAAKQSAAPAVLDSDKTPLSESSGIVYSGCYVNASLDIWAQDNSYGQRVNAQLRGIQFVADGDSFGGGRPASADEFDDLTEGTATEDDDIPW